MGSSLGVFVTGGNEPYLILRRSFVGKTLKTIGRPGEMAGDGISDPLAVPTRWALLDLPSTGPWRSWYVWM